VKVVSPQVLEVVENLLLGVSNVGGNISEGVSITGGITESPWVNTVGGRL
jgi:hypothetical protein